MAEDAKTCDCGSSDETSDGRCLNCLLPIASTPFVEMKTDTYEVWSDGTTVTTMINGKVVDQRRADDVRQWYTPSGPSGSYRCEPIDGLLRMRALDK